MSTFLLIHGGAHRGWHWHLLQSELERLGHDSVAPDVPMEDPGAGTPDWAEAAIASIKGVPEGDVILVGHSLAGLALPIVASRISPRRMVFLCANVPVPGVAYNDYLEEYPGAHVMKWERYEWDDQGRVVIPPDVAAEVFYPDVPTALAREAFEHAVPCARTGAEEPCPLESWPAVPASYILCTEDRVVGPDWSREVSEERLGGPALELEGGHSPFLARPAELAAVLDQLTEIRT